MWAGRLEFVTLLALIMKIFVSAKEGVRIARGEAE